MRFFYCVVVCFLWLASGFWGTVEGQTGHYFVKNFNIDATRQINSYYSVLQDERGLVYVANRSGILRFDGRKWERIPCPGAVFSMLMHNNQLYVGGKFGYGRIEKTVGKGFSYIPLNDSTTKVSNIYNISEDEGYLYFLSSAAVHVINSTTNKNAGLILAEGGNLFMNLIRYDNDLLVTTEKEEIKQLVGVNLVEYNALNSISGRPLFIERYDDNKYLVGNTSNQLFIIENTKSKKLLIKEDQFLQQNVITSAKWMNDTLIAVGTLRGGISFIGLNSNSIIQIINGENGLHDNEVLDIETDRDGGLWAAQNNGLDRIDPFLPISDFSHYPGLNGDLMSVFPFGKELYLSTNLGVYHLQKEVKTKSTERVVTRKTSISTTPQQDQVEEKRGVFGKVKRDRKSNKESSQGIFRRLFGSPTSESTDSIWKEKLVDIEILSTKYLYKELEEIGANNSLFTDFKGHLINGGVSGLFEITGDTSIQISQDPIKDILSTKNGYLLAATANNEVIYYSFNNGKWEIADRISQLSDQVQYLFEDSKGNLWFTGFETVYHLNKVDEEYQLDNYDLVNPYSEQTLIKEKDGQVYFINSTGYYRINPTTNAFEHDVTLETQLGKPIRYFGHETPTSWVFNGEFWHHLGDNLHTQRTEILNMIQDIRAIYFNAEGEYFWIIDAQNRLLKLDYLVNRIPNNYSLILKDLYQQGNEIGFGEIVEVIDINGKISIEYVQPDYRDVLGIKYRYVLSGLNSEWSEWSDDNVFSFPYLPPGDYEILVQSKDIFGQINQSKPLKFKVLPPYWKRPWFYAVEMFLFVFLLFISLHLNRKYQDSYSIISRLIAFLTLVLMIEFVQAIAEAKFALENSPVFNFFIQVVVASAVLPVESVMRRWLTGEEKGRDMIMNQLNRFKKKK